MVHGDLGFRRKWDEGDADEDEKDEKDEAEDVDEHERTSHPKKRPKYRSGGISQISYGRS